MVPHLRSVLRARVAELGDELEMADVKVEIEETATAVAERQQVLAAHHQAFTLPAPTSTAGMAFRL